MNQRKSWVLLLAMAASCSPCALADVQYGVTPQGHRYAMGGVGQAESAQLRLQRTEYSLGITTAARSSGAYLSDVAVEVRRSDGREVSFRGTIDGPMLLLDLPPGAYAVTADFEGATVARRVVIPARGRQELVLYFDVPADVLHPEASAIR